MKQLPLSQGKFALLDDEDYERLRHFRWFYRPNFPSNLVHISLQHRRPFVCTKFAAAICFASNITQCITLIALKRQYSLPFVFRHTSSPQTQVNP